MATFYLGCRVCKKASTMRCSKCKSVVYCSVDCQKVDFQKHKIICNLPIKDLPIVDNDIPIYRWLNKHPDKFEEIKKMFSTNEEYNKSFSIDGKGYDRCLFIDEEKYSFVNYEYFKDKVDDNLYNIIKNTCNEKVKDKVVSVIKEGNKVSCSGLNIKFI